MMVRALCVAAVCVGVGVVALGEDAAKKPKGDEPTAKSIYEFTVSDIDGKEVALAKYKGDVCIIVNVASL
jgi:cytochrome oxidase Cu insertion factor (SCO1/SenC/PrrC family)